MEAEFEDGFPLHFSNAFPSRNARGLDMRPEHEPRRLIIREWMSQPRDKRQNREQAEAFAVKAAEKHLFRCSGERSQRILAWLLSRTGKA